MASPAESAPDIVLLQPPAGGLVSGGYRFNQGLANSLRERGAGTLEEWEPGHPLPLNPARVVLVDSLYLGRPAGDRIRRWLEDGQRRGYLLGHYLPMEDASLDEEQKATWQRNARTWLSTLRGVFCTGDRQREAWRRHFPGLGEIHFLPPAIPDLRTAPYPEKAVSSPVRLVTVGTLFPGKGQHEILDTLREIRDAPFRWDLIGSREADPAYASQFAQRLQDEGLGGSVFLHGCLSPESCAALLEGAHLCVSASRFESFGMAHAEALARGVPLLAYDVGDLTLWVTPGPGAWIMDPCDTAAWRRQLIHLVREPGSISPPDEAPRLPARSWEETADRLLEVLQPLTAGRGNTFPDQCRRGRNAKGSR
jgi:glycosyltransferase involved in cell wall biosynthesis